MRKTGLYRRFSAPLHFLATILARLVYHSLSRVFFYHFYLSLFSLILIRPRLVFSASHMKRIYVISLLKDHIFFLNFSDFWQTCGVPVQKINMGKKLVTLKRLSSVLANFFRLSLIDESFYVRFSSNKILVTWCLKFAALRLKHIY